MTQAPVLLDVSDGIATVTLNRPEVRNALSSEVLRLLPELMRNAEADDDVSVIVLTGADPAFCAGLDLTELGSTGINSGSGGGSDNPPARSGARGPFPRLTKPLIGAINGVAVTGGFELALNCDFLIASERAKFGDTHTRVGVMPGWGLTVLLPQAIGVRRAREMSFTGNFMSADEALAARARQPRRAARRTDPVHPIDRRRHREQRVRRRPPDPPDVRRDRPRRRRLGDRGPRLACLAALDVEPRDDRRPPRRDPGSRPNAVSVRYPRRGRGGRP